MVSIVAFQAVDPSSILGHRISFIFREKKKQFFFLDFKKYIFSPVGPGVTEEYVNIIISTSITTLLLRGHEIKHIGSTPQVIYLEG